MREGTFIGYNGKEEKAFMIYSMEGLYLKMETGGVSAVLPKFSSKAYVEMQKILQEMGIKQAFVEEKADFSKMERMSRKDVFISTVLQNSYINVDEAGAVTQVGVNGAGISKTEVILNRPFVYAVIDNRTKLPVYIGAVLNMET